MIKPESVGMSSTRLKTLDRVMAERYVASGMLPGILTMVCRKDEIVHIGMAGSMDLEREKTIREDAIFRVYSMSKPITAVALMMLVEEGALGLDDDVHKHIPSWTHLGVYQSSGGPLASPGKLPQFITTPPQRPMKVIDLATHMSGLTYGGLFVRTGVDAAYRDLGIGDRETKGGLDTMVEQLSTIPLEFSPGSRWNYSLSTDVLGYLVQKLSGMSFGHFLKTRLFEPLGMVDTDFYVPAEKLDRFASCYQPAEGGGLKLQDDAGASIFAAPPALESGGGGLVSTAHDYMRFCRMMLNGGTLDGVQILSPKTVELFSLNYLPGGRMLIDLGRPDFLEAIFPTSCLGFSLACGVNIDVAQSRMPGTVGEYFWGGAATTLFFVDPIESLAVVFMTQVLGLQPNPTQEQDLRTLQRDLRTLVYSAMIEANSSYPGGD